MADARGRLVWQRLVGCLLVAGVTACPKAIHAVQEDHAVASASYTEADERLVAELEAEIERIPPEERTQKGFEIIQAHLHEAESDDLRGMMLISLAVRSKAMGQPEQSKGFLAQAMELCSGDTGLSAAWRLMDLYREEYNYAAAAETAMYVLNERELSPEQDVRFTGELGVNLAADDKSDEALALVHGLLDKYPGHADLIAEYSETVAINQGMRGNATIYYAGMKWIEDHAPAYAASPRFLGNFAHACREDERVEEAKQLYLRVIHEFPEHNRVPEFLLELGNIHKEAGDLLGAYSFYMSLLEREPRNDKEKTLHQIAKNNLISIERDLGVEDALSEMARRSMASLEDVKAPDGGEAAETSELQAGVIEHPTNMVTSGKTVDAAEQRKNEGGSASHSVMILCAGVVVVALATAVALMWRRKRVNA